MTLFSRAAQITTAEMLSFLDNDGRLLRESDFRKAVFKGGVDIAARKCVWEYLLGYFPFQSTRIERDIIRKTLQFEYSAMKEHWKRVLEPATAVPDAGYGDDDEGDPADFFMKLQANVKAQSHKINEPECAKCMRIIKKDVPRTDRKEKYFAGDDNEHLNWLSDILITYAVYHPEIGYAQGMNDLLAMILFVMDNEADAYNCFCGYMEAIREDFNADGMVAQLKQVSCIKI